MTDNELEEIREVFEEAEDLDPRLHAELRRVVSRFLYFGGLPDSYAPHGRWDADSEEEVLHAWLAKRLIGGGKLQALLDKARSAGGFRSMAERSLRQYLLNERERSQAQNLFWRTRELLEADDDFELAHDAKRVQDRGWRPRGSTTNGVFEGSDEELAAAAWSLGDFTIIRFHASAKKLAHVLSIADLKRFVLGLLGALEVVLTLTQVMRAAELRFDLGQVQFEELETVQDEVALDVADQAALQQTALAVIAEMTARQVEVLLDTAADEPLKDIAERCSCSQATAHNEQRRVGELIKRYSADGEEAEALLKMVCDSLYEEGETP